MTYTLHTTADGYEIRDEHGNYVDGYDRRDYQRAYERVNALNTRAAELAAVVSDPATWEAVSEPRCELCEAPAVLVGEQWTCPECCPIPATRDEAIAAGLPCYDSEIALCCEHCGEVMSDAADAELVGDEMWCAGCVGEAEARRLIGELSQVSRQWDAALSEGRGPIAHALRLAYEGLSDRIRELGWEIGPDGRGGYELWPADSTINVYLSAEAA